MTQPPRVDFSDPGEKDRIALGSESEIDDAHEETRPTEPVKLDIADPHFMSNAFDIYADLRASGPVSRVRFVAGEEEAGDGAKEQRPEDFFGRETFFVTH